MRFLLLVLLLLLVKNYSQAQKIDSFDIDTTRITVKTSAWKQFVPSNQLPKELNIRKSNANVDCVKYKDRYYVAFRTAPYHFPAAKTWLYLISSDDFENWTYEAEYHVGGDIREPRFAVFKDTLFLYFFEGGKTMTTFRPKYIWESHSTGDQHWTIKKSIHLDGYVPWRLKSRNDTLYLSAYYGVNLYKNKHEAELRLFQSVDGRKFTPISSGAQITTKGAEEGEFEFDAEGNLWAVIRLEGVGAYIAYADKDSLEKWQTWYKMDKYDSALLFAHNDRMYLISRRNLKGAATKWDTDHPTKKQRRKNLIRYSATKKRTAIFRLDKANKALVHIMDFPSTGDNAFPALAPINEHSYHLLNYSSNINKKKEINWINGQLRKTFLYHTVLTIEEKPIN
ncbi:MAG: hypothetical protein MK212_04935 [Saprospiraceae bacterium]|nr:hypothetical protein [Saprospiraceae bacterium]